MESSWRSVPATNTFLHRRFMKLLDELQSRFEIKNDRQLAAKLELSTPVISRIRNGKSAVSADVMIRIHEVLGLPIAEIKGLCQ
jgi:plasmid maintenance system antidote protein VapI